MSTVPPTGYWIQDPDNVVEASFSSEPDDVSIASIRILANPDTPATVHHLEIEVEVYAPTEGDETIPENTLTRNPRSITPQALDHGDWEMTTNGNGVFTATARQPLVLKEGRSGWVLYLRDVDVINRIGTTDITVREYRGDGTSAPTNTATLPVRKIQPKLRIDHFEATDKDSLPVSHTTASGADNVTLSWATTGATKVTLYGPAGVVNLGTGVDATYLDHTHTTTVDTTSTFTLVAEGAGGHVVEQLTVTVANQTKVANLVVEGEIHGLGEESNEVVFADDVRMKGSLAVVRSSATSATVWEGLQLGGALSSTDQEGGFYTPVQAINLDVNGNLNVYSQRDKTKGGKISMGKDGSLIIHDWKISQSADGHLMFTKGPNRVELKTNGGLVVNGLE